MAGELELPPGFRFHPTDEELVTHYLCRKCASQPISVPIIAEIDLYKYDPWQLPELAKYGEKEWYFFSPRDRKYPNGSRPNRAAGSGYWKATGADKPIGQPKALAIKKALVFYAGKAPKGEKTNWIMHEYRLADVDRSARKRGSGLRLDDWVLCRIYNKKGTIEKLTTPTKRPQPTITFPTPNHPTIKTEDMRPDIVAHTPPAISNTTNTFNDYIHFDTAESIPKLHTDSSCSEHVVSPEFHSEVNSEPKWKELEKAFDMSYGNYYNVENPFLSSADLQDGGGDQLSPLQDMFMYNMPKPF